MRDPEALKQLRPLALAREPHVSSDREMGEQPVVLRQVADPASLRAEVNGLLGVEPQLTGERDPSFMRALKAGDGAQQRGLASAGRADDRDRLRAEVQRGAKIERPPGEGDVDFEEVHKRTSSFEVSRIAALTTISSTPIATA